MGLESWKIVVCDIMLPLASLLLLYIHRGVYACIRVGEGEMGDDNVIRCISIMMTSIDTWLVHLYQLYDSYQYICNHAIIFLLTYAHTLTHVLPPPATPVPLSHWGLP